MIHSPANTLPLPPFQTGAGTAMSVLGMPDLGLTTVDDMVRNAGMIASLDRDVPVIADADTGYGGPLMVARTVRTRPSRFPSLGPPNT